MTRLLLVILLLFCSLPAFAQESAEAEDRSFFIQFVEERLSTANRQIRISNIQGALSSNATIGEISVADREGIWLRITNARIVWTRSALLLGRLSIATLAADRIDVLRRPLPEEGLPEPEAGEFALPELPLSITIDALQVPRIAFGEGVFGLASEISATGRFSLAGGSLDTALEIVRLDGPGGRLALSAQYANATEVLAIDLTLDEPENGIVANALNIEGRPPIRFAVSGDGPLAELDVALTLDAAAERVLTGTARLRREPEGIAFSTDLSGPISRLIPARFRDFFGPETSLIANGLVKDQGGFRLDNLALQSAALGLDAAAETTADGFLQRLALNARIDNETDERIILPVPGGQTMVQSALLNVTFGGAAGDAWNGTLAVEDLSTGAFAARNVNLTMGGVAQNLNQPSARRITFAVEGGAEGVIPTSADVAEAIGDAITLDIAGEWDAGQPIQLSRASLVSEGLRVDLAGSIADYAFNGDLTADVADLAPFSLLAGRELTGRLELATTGEIRPISGGFDLTIDGRARELTIGAEAADNLLAGETRVTGRLTRDETGFAADDFRVFNDRVSLTADGRIATGAADFSFDVSLSDLSLVSERAEGALTATGRATGSEGPIALTLTARVPSGELLGRNLNDAALVFEGTLNDGQLEGQLGGDAFLGGERVRLSAGLALLEEEARLSTLDFSAGATRITGDISRTQTGLLTGELALVSADISTAAALLLTEATGAVNAEVTLTPAGAAQNAEISADVGSLAVGDIRIGEGRIEASIADLFNVPVANGTIVGRDVSAAGIDIAELNARAERQGTTTSFTAEARLANGARASAAAALTPEAGGGYRGVLEEAELVQGDLAARLAQPTAITVIGQDITVDNLRLDVGGGSVTATGTASEKLDLQLAITALPLEIANVLVPDLGLGGTIDGTARLTGTRTAPNATFDIEGRSISAAALREAGIQSATVDAAGTTEAGRLTVRATVASPEGLRATANGTVPLGEGEIGLDVEVAAFPLAVLNTVLPEQSLGGMLSGSARVTGTLADPAAAFDTRVAGFSAAVLERVGLSPLDVTATGSFADQVVTLSSARATGPQGFALTATGQAPVGASGSLALDVEVAAFPLALLNTVAPGQALGGALTGTARVTGTLADPAASFEARASGVRAAPLDNAGLSPLDVTATGSFANRVVTLSSARASGPQGFAVTASGSLPLAGTGANLSIEGSAPLAIANRLLANRGAQASGTVAFSATVAGSLQQPSIRGSFSTAGAQLIDPQTNIRLVGIAASGSIDGDTVRIASATAGIAGGGTISVTGTVSISGQAGFPADLRIVLTDARYADGNFVVATLGGTLSLAGPLARDPLLSGEVLVSRAEISVAEGLRGGAAAIDVTHVNPPADVAATLRRARVNEASDDEGGAGGIRLDLTINAPNRVFVRGRGLDAELGGSVRLTGPLNDVQPVGALELIRGRLAILGQRITFDEGSVTLVGDLDPFLNFVARSEGSDITVFVTVSGRVSDLDISFSAQPELPEDEVLARLIFGRGLNELSPLQIAQLAAAAAELAGGQNTSLLDRLRSATGLDDLDVVTDSEGNVAVRAGRYVQENVYLGVEAGAQGSARATINLDITENLKARGSAGTDGGGSLGIFYEKDY